MKSRQYSGVVKDGKLPGAVSGAIRLLLSGMEGKQVSITIKETKRIRSLSQNAFYWGFVLPAVRQMFKDAGDTLTSEETHDFLKAHVGKLVKTVMGKQIAATSTDLSTQEWEEFVEKIRAWAAPFGYEVPFPGETFMRAG